jgi:hypothetical protein
VNGTLTGANGLWAGYDAVTNKLYLKSDNGGTWLGGFAPGSPNVISNSQGSLDCANTTVTRSGNILTVRFRLTASGAWANTSRKVWLKVYDQAGYLEAGWATFYLLWGAAALHGSMRGLSERARDQEIRLSRSRLVLLGAASLTAQFVRIWQLIHGQRLAEVR